MIKKEDEHMHNHHEKPSNTKIESIEQKIIEAIDFDL